MICNKCSAENEKGAVFCGNCGARLEPEAPVPEAAERRSENTKKKLGLPGVMLIAAAAILIAAGAAVALLNLLPVKTQEKALSVPERKAEEFIKGRISPENADRTTLQVAGSIEVPAERLELIAKRLSQRPGSASYQELLEFFEQYDQFVEVFVGVTSPGARGTGEHTALRPVTVGSQNGSWSVLEMLDGEWVY